MQDAGGSERRGDDGSLREGSTRGGMTGSGREDPLWGATGQVREERVKGLEKLPKFATGIAVQELSCASKRGSSPGKGGRGLKRGEDEVYEGPV